MAASPATSDATLMSGFRKQYVQSESGPPRPAVSKTLIDRGHPWEIKAKEEKEPGYVSSSASSTAHTPKAYYSNAPFGDAGGGSRGAGIPLVRNTGMIFSCWDGLARNFLL